MNGEEEDGSSHFDWRTTTEFPVLIRAWGEALQADGSRSLPPQFQRYINAHPDEQKEMLREIYMFLQAQQLVAITSRLDQMARDQRIAARQLKKLTSEKPPPPTRWWGLGWSGLVTLSLSGAALVVAIWTATQTQGR